MRAPLRLAVVGRPGVGRSTVASALAGPATVLTADPRSAELCVRVIAETFKPEDRRAVRSSPVPALVVLNKADLAGADPGGPLVCAQRCATALAASAGVPVVPMIALLASVDLGDDEMAALRVLTTEAPDLTSTDAFVDAPHRLRAGVRAKLLAALDRFGLAHALLAVADGADAAAVARRLRELSQVDQVLEQLTAAAAPVRYRRVCDAIRELRVLATVTGDERLAAFISSDEVVIAVMAAAADVLQACGIPVEVGVHAGAEGGIGGGGIRVGDSAAHLRRAVHWRRYADGPVDRTHHRCATDLVRGSLRLLSATR